MKAIGVEEFKVLQMEIADFVDKVCKENNIRYSLACGTLIGAIRHGGYIPWDDDLDIMLPREDYKRLMEVWDDTKYPYIFHTVEKGNNYGFPYGKISNPKTLLNDNGCTSMGVNIDVYPMDDVVNIDDFKCRHQSVLDLYLEMSYVNRSLTGSLNTIIRNLFRKIQHYPNTPKSVAKKINELASSKNDMGGQFMFEMVAGRGYKGPFEKQSFDSTIEKKFENHTYQVLKGYDNYLTANFGDYMKLPPVEKRVSHHNFKAWWK